MWIKAILFVSVLTFNAAYAGDLSAFPPKTNEKTTSTLTAVLSSCYEQPGSGGMCAAPGSVCSSSSGQVGYCVNDVFGCRCQ